MPLKKLQFAPGFNKQATASGAEGQWIDGDNVRFRTGLPEKIGGWKQLTVSQKELPGVARAQHAFTSLAGSGWGTMRAVEVSLWVALPLECWSQGWRFI